MDQQQQKWEHLPQCAMVSLFHHLSLNDRRNASLACREWNRCLFAAELWNQYKFICNRNGIGIENMLTFVKKLGKVVKSIEIVCEKDEEHTSATCEILKTFLSLKQIQLNKIALTVMSDMCIEPNQPKLDNNILQILNLLKQLLGKPPDGKYNNFECVCLNNTPIVPDDDLIVVLSENNPNLQVLNIQTDCAYEQRCQVLHSGSHLNLVKSCQYLTELHTHYEVIDENVLEVLYNNPNKQFKFLSLNVSKVSEITSSQLISADTWKLFGTENQQAKVKIMIKKEIPFFRYDVIQRILCSAVPLFSLEIDKLDLELIKYLSNNFFSTLNILIFKCLQRDFRPYNYLNADRALLELVNNCSYLKELHCHNRIDTDVVQSILDTEQLQNHSLRGHDVYDEYVNGPLMYL